MEHARPFDALALDAVEVSCLLGGAGFLDSHPAVHHVTRAVDGGLTVWIDPALSQVFAQCPDAPDRPAEVELHGPGAPCEALLAHPRTEYAEVFFDGLGDPESAPLGWWHARVWLRAD